MRALVAVVALLTLISCSGDPGAGPIEPAWDRDACERCRMAISDRAFAAQVRLRDDGRARHFDDLGCALLWLDEARDEGRTESEIWVRDLDGSGWLEARQATFHDGKRTPMGYGLGASRAGGSLGLEQAWKLVREKERERRPAH